MFDSDQLKQHAKSALNSETTTDEEKTAASQALQRLRAAKKTKAEIAACGKRPVRRSFNRDEEGERLFREAMHAYWDALDKRAIRRDCERILNDRSSTPLVRLHARERLDLLEGRLPKPEIIEPVKPVESESQTPSHNRLSAEELAEERKKSQAFLDSLFQNGPPPLPKLQEPKKAEPPPKPIIDPALNCEACRVPYRVCFCNVLTCPLCLQPRASCSAPCPRARIQN